MGTAVEFQDRYIHKIIELLGVEEIFDHQLQLLQFVYEFLQAEKALPESFKPFGPLLHLLSASGPGRGNALLAPTDPCKEFLVKLQVIFQRASTTSMHPLQHFSCIGMTHPTHCSKSFFTPVTEFSPLLFCLHHHFLVSLSHSFFFLLSHLPKNTTKLCLAYSFIDHIFVPDLAESSFPLRVGLTSNLI